MRGLTVEQSRQLHNKQNVAKEIAVKMEKIIVFVETANTQETWANLIDYSTERQSFNFANDERKFFDGYITLIKTKAFFF